MKKQSILLLRLVTVVRSSREGTETFANRRFHTVLKNMEKKGNGRAVGEERRVKEIKGVKGGRSLHQRGSKVSGRKSSLCRKKDAYR